MDVKLKPCPFCGSSVSVFIFDANEISGCDCEPSCVPYFVIVCSVNEIEYETPNWKAGCGASSGYEPSKELAIQAWNRRA